MVVRTRLAFPVRIVVDDHHDRVFRLSPEQMSVQGQSASSSSSSSASSASSASSRSLSESEYGVAAEDVDDLTLLLAKRKRVGALRPLVTASLKAIVWSNVKQVG